MKKFYFLPLFFLVLVSCQKEALEETVPTLPPVTRGTIEPLPDFDWESAIYLQTYTGPVRMPWLTGQNTLVPYAQNFDMKKENGWELIYNDAANPSQNTTPMLIFYNIPRGLLRFYIYADRTNVSANSLFLNLSFSRASTILANAIGETNMTPLPANAKVTLSALKSDHELVGFSVGFWHWGEFDVSYYDGYDSGNIVGTISAIATTVSGLEIDGTSEGTIEGSIVAKQQTGVSNYSLLGNLNLNTGSGAGKKMKEELDTARMENPAFYQQLWNKVKESGKSGTLTSVGDLVSKVATGAINWAANPLMSLFNSFIGGNAKSTPQEFAVNLTTNSTLKLNGTLSTTLPVFSKSFNIPLNNPVEGQVSNLDQKIGVWYLSEQPAIIHSASARLPPNSMYYNVTDIVRISDFNVLINPTMSDKYEIRNIEKYIVVRSDYSVKKTAAFIPAYYKDNREYNKVANGWRQISTASDWWGYSDLWRFWGELFVSFSVVEKATGQETFHSHKLNHTYRYNDSFSSFQSESELESEFDTQLDNI